MSYKINNGSNFIGLTIADNRFTTFEETYDANARLIQELRAPDKPLCDSDYFGILPIDNHQILHHKRLYAIVERAKHTQAEEQMAAENDRKQAAKLSF